MSVLDEVINKINKGYGEKIITYGVTTDEYKKIKKIPFTSPRANYMMYGGIPRGRIIEFAGEPSGGKTTTALDITAHAQEIFNQEYEDKVNNSKKESKGAIKQQVLYVDAENTLDLDWAVLLGVNLDDLILYKPQEQSAEEIFEDIYSIVKTGTIGLVIIDSLGVLISGQAYEKSIEQRTYGGISMPLTIFSKKISPICSKFNCTLIGINQIRDNMNSMYGGVTTTGGKAWQHTCSLRVMFRKGAFVNELGDEIKKSSEDPAGNKVSMDIIKSKCFRSDRRVGFYTLNYSYGIDSSQDLFDIAIKYDYIHQGGAWYTFRNPITKEDMYDSDGNLLKFQGKRNVLSALDENPEVRKVIEDAINKLIYDFDNEEKDLLKESVEEEDKLFNIPLKSEE